MNVRAALALAASLAAAVAAAGCTLVRIEQGEPVGAADARAVKAGDSKASVLATLGAPEAMFPILGGSIFEYSFRVTDTEALDISAIQASASISATETRTDRLVVRFDREGRVREVGYPVGLRSAVR